MKGQIRIIGGIWRGRKIKVPEESAVRPTPDRVRETVFNWLRMVTPGAHCLDAFAGSGALGLEALSRGAANVIFVDESVAVVRHLQATLTHLQATNAEVYRATLPQQLKKPQKPVDLVFLDPPYAANLLFPICFYLEENGFLAKDAYIYLESKTELQDNMFPPTWHRVKMKKAGQVFYHLAHRVSLAEG